MCKSISKMVRRVRTFQNRHACMEFGRQLNIKNEQFDFRISLNSFPGDISFLTSRMRISYDTSPLTLSLPESNLESINVVVPFKSVDESQVCGPFKWKLLSSAFKWCCLFLTILQNDIQYFFLSFEHSTFGGERVNYIFWHFNNIIFLDVSQHRVDAEKLLPCSRGQHFKANITDSDRFC